MNTPNRSDCIAFQRDKKVACFSVAAVDYYPQLDRYFVGGNALNQAVRFQSMGFDSAFIGAVGTDDGGDMIVDFLTERNIDTSHLHRINEKSPAAHILNDAFGERSGINPGIQNEIFFNYLLSDDDWSYMKTFDIWSTHANGVICAEAMKHKTADQFFVVDFLHFDSYELLLSGLDTIDIAYFGGQRHQLGDLIDISKQFQGLIVLTLGAGGSIAIKNGQTYTQKALPIEKVIDTTGCGDAFQSGFTSEYYFSKDIEKALLRGAEMGRIAASHYGSVGVMLHDMIS